MAAAAGSLASAYSPAPAPGFASSIRSSVSPAPGPAAASSTGATGCGVPAASTVSRGVSPAARAAAASAGWLDLIRGSSTESSHRRSSRLAPGESSACQ